MGSLISYPVQEVDAGKDNNEVTAFLGIVEQIVSMVQGMGELFTDSTDVPYITVDETGATYPLQSSSFREVLSHKFYQRNDRALKSQQLNDALTTLSGCAKYDGGRHDVFVRVAVLGAGYLLDMGDDEWRAIYVDKDGYEIIDKPSVKFVRPRGSLPLQKPDKNGKKEDLLSLINVEECDLPLLVACLCEFLRPDTAYPVVEICGEHGSGKSVTQGNIRALIDPKDVNLRAAPKRAEDIFISARNNHIVSYNNISHLSAEFQDAFCCLATGGGFASRKLYTDGDEATFNAKRPIIMNGIVTLATQADLISRVVRINCPKIKDRLSDAALAELAKEKGPLALGYILNIFSEALRKLPSVSIADAPRMMDFAELGEAVSQTMGHRSGVFIDRYQKSINDAARQSIEGAPVIEQLVKHIKIVGGIKITVGDLYEVLTNKIISRPHGWPKSARGLRNSIDRHKGVLREMGIVVEDGGKSNKGRLLKFTVTIEAV